MKSADMPAMPVQGFTADASGALAGQYFQHAGLTKREMFAAMAMQGMLSDSDSTGAVEEYAAAAVEAADALLAALDASRPMEPKP